jgi:thiosulfate/3-mercaptopyruvate sulfurtransferase
MEGSADPPVLVSTSWVAEHLDARDVVLVEVDTDASYYHRAHIPGAVGWSWKSQLNDTVRRDLPCRSDLERLLGEAGIEPETTVVLYGDSSNWFAAWAFWLLEMHGHRHLRMLDGDREGWMREGWPTTVEVPQRARTRYRAAPPDRSSRALLTEVHRNLGEGCCEVLDVRSPEEFAGALLAPPGMPETCQRGGHIPGARNVPWSVAVEPADGRFRPASELRAIYRTHGIDGARPVITYCRIGERASHTWFVLRHLLGFPQVRIYDGSWTEWGNLVGVPVGRGL